MPINKFGSRPGLRVNDRAPDTIHWALDFIHLFRPVAYVVTIPNQPAWYTFVNMKIPDVRVGDWLEVITSFEITGDGRENGADEVRITCNATNPSFPPDPLRGWTTYSGAIRYCQLTTLVFVAKPISEVVVSVNILPIHNKGGTVQNVSFIVKTLRKRL